MSKSEKYIMSSDYATLRNDSNTITITVNIPATSIGGSGTTQEYENTGTVGSAGAPMEYDINCSISSRRWKSNYVLVVENSGTANQYQLLIYVFRDSSTTVKVKVVAFRGGVGAVTKNARTITVRVRTFIPPFA